jgi:hypothetical protein
MGTNEDVDPEHESVEAFVEFCMDDEQDTFTHVDLGHIAYATHTSRCVVRKALEDYGLTLKVRAVARRRRGFTTNSNDRYYGPGSSKSHGGSGHSQIRGIAGQKG